MYNYLDNTYFCISATKAKTHCHLILYFSRNLGHFILQSLKNWICLMKLTYYLFNDNMSIS